MIPLSALTIDYFGKMIARSTEAQLATESQILLRSFVEELRTASSVKDSTSISDPNEPVSGWSTSNENLILIISTPALNASKQFIYDPLTSKPYQNEYVYFAEGNRLYKRILAHPNATANSAQTTCPAAISTASCPHDRVLTENFKAMSFVLYDQDDAVTSTIALTRSLVVNVSMEKPAYERKIKFNNSMRMTMRNTL